MSRANRAAQFAPFDALKGLQEALREKEEQLTRVEKKELSEESQILLSEALTEAEKGMKIEVVFFYKGHYITLMGKLKEKNTAYRYLMIDNSKIFFSDLYEVKIVEN